MSKLTCHTHPDSELRPFVEGGMYRAAGGEVQRMVALRCPREDCRYVRYVGASTLESKPEEAEPELGLEYGEVEMVPQQPGRYCCQLCGAYYVECECGAGRRFEQV